MDYITERVVEMKITERKLFFRYFASSMLLIVSIITYSVAWGHWAYTLNTCPGYDCSCILYGKSFSELQFVGGEGQYCQFIIVAQIIIFGVSVVLTCYHGYRVFIKTKKEQRKRATKANPLLAGKRVGNKKDDIILDTVPAEPEPDPPSKGMTITLFIVSLLMLILMIGTFTVAIDGFFKSCNEYRKTLVRLLGASGNVADIFNNRIACPSIFDFMDYLQPDRKNYNEPYDYIRRDKINTGVCLLLGKLTLTMNTMNWIFLTFFNLSFLCKKTGCCKRNK